MIVYLLYTLLLLILSHGLFRKKLDSLDCFAILLPIKALSFDVGLGVWAYYVPLLILALKMGFSNWSKLYIPKSLTFLCIYIVISTIFISNYCIDTWVVNAYHDGFFRNSGRYITALLKFIFIHSGIYVILINTTLSKDKIFKLLKLYVYSCLFMAIFGIFQFILFPVLLYDILPMTSLQTGNSRSAFVQPEVLHKFHPISKELWGQGRGLIRACSIGGEPKNLGTSLVIAFVISVFFRKEIFLNRTRNIISLLILALCLIFTFSRSGYGLFFIFILVMLSFITFWKGKEIFKMNELKVIVIMCLCLFLLFNTTLSNFVHHNFVLNFSDMLREHVDKYIQIFLLQNPQWILFGSGTGNIHHLVNSLLPYTDFSKDGIFVSRYGYMRLISENGIVGFGLFSLFIRQILARRSKIGYRSYLNEKFFAFCLIIVIFFFFRVIFAELMFVLALFTQLINLQVPSSNNYDSSLVEN